MNPARATYSMFLAGAAGGLLAWGVASVFTFAYTGDSALADVVLKLVFGMLVGMAAGAAGGSVTHGSASAESMLADAGLGLLGSGLAAALDWPIYSSLGTPSPFAARIIGWMLLGGLTAVAISFRAWRKQPARLPAPLACGLAGGALAGVLMSLAGELPDVLPALAYMLAGSGTAGLIPLQVALRGPGIVEFVSSGDRATHEKLTRQRASWRLQEGQACVFGRADDPAGPGSTDIGVHIGDPEVAPRHLRVHARDGRFILSRHVEIRDQAGLSRWVLKVGEQSVIANHTLQDGDNILLGTTVLAFHILPEDE